MSAPGQTTHFWSGKARVEGDETGRQKEHASVRGGGMEAQDISLLYRMVWYRYGKKNLIDW